MRGGAAAGVAVTPHDTEELHAMLIGHGVEVPNSTGAFGGFEASCNQAVLRRRRDGEELPLGQVDGPDSLAALDGSERLGPKPGHFPLRAGDVLAYGFQGGGGYGDPLERDPAAVAHDVAEGMVSRESAAGQYGVVIGDDGVETDPTAALRLATRRERLGGREPIDVADEADREAPRNVGGAFTLTEGRLSCARCGQGLGTAAEDFKQRAETRRIEAEAHGTRILLHPELELREHSCPACAALLESEVARGDAPSLVSFELRP
jgi:N-methylhydantoinase B